MVEWTGKEELPKRRGTAPDFERTRMLVVGVSGLAGAGKSTFTEGLLEAANAAPDIVLCKETPLAGPLKWVLEGLWGLDPGTLSTVAGKAGVVLGWEDPRAWVAPLPTEEPFPNWKAANRVSRLPWRKGELEQAVARADQVVAALRERFPDGNLPLRVAMQAFGTDICRAVRDSFWVDTHYALVWGDERELPHPGPFTSLRTVPDVRFDNEAAYVHSLGGIVVRVVRPGQVSGDAHASEAGVSDGLVDLLVQNSGSADDLRSLGKALFAKLADAEWRWYGLPDWVDFWRPTSDGITCIPDGGQRG